MRAAANRQVRERGPLRETGEPDLHRKSPRNDHRAPSDDRNRSITDEHHIASALGQAGLVGGAAHSAIPDSRRFGIGRRDYAVCGLGSDAARVLAPPPSYGADVIECTPPPDPGRVGGGYDRAMGCLLSCSGQLSASDVELRFRCWRDRQQVAWLAVQG